MVWTVGDIATGLAAECVGDASLTVLSVGEPGPDTPAGLLAMALSPSYLQALKISPCQSAIIPASVDWQEYSLKAAILLPDQHLENPRLLMSKITRSVETPSALEAGIHSSAVVEDTARIGKNVAIGAFVYIGANTTIGDGCRIESHCHISQGVSIGEDAYLQSGVRIGRDVIIGAGCRILYNAVIGADGFSYTRELDPMSMKPEEGAAPKGKGEILRIASLGSVEIGKQVDIGACCTIDRGTLKNTKIGDCCKIDNLVQIAHNCRLGTHCRIAANAGIAGSATLGDYIIVGGGSGIADHVVIGSHSIIYGATNVAGKWPERSILMGTPAREHSKAINQLMALGRLPRLIKDIKALKKLLSPSATSD